jgi:hypothetical protein
MYPFERAPGNRAPCSEAARPAPVDRGGRSAQVAVKLARWPPLASVGRRLPLIGGLERLYPDGDRSGRVCERTLLQLGLLFAVVHPEPAGRLVLARSSGAAGATDAQAKGMPPRRRGDCLIWPVLEQRQPAKAGSAPISASPSAPCAGGWRVSGPGPRLTQAEDGLAADPLHVHTKQLVTQNMESRRHANAASWPHSNAKTGSTQTRRLAARNTASWLRERLLHD